MNYSFYCRESKVNKKGLSPIELSLIVNGKRTYIALERKEQPAIFKKLMGEKRNNDLKVYLDIIRNRINCGLNDLMLSGSGVSINSLKEYILYGGIRQYSVGELADAFLKYQMTKVNAGDCTKQVYLKYVHMLNHFMNYVGKTTDCNSINYTKCYSFYMHMKSIYVDATLSGQMFRLKSVFNYGIDNGFVVSNPFAKIKVSKPQVKIEFLTEDEIERLKTTTITNASLDKLRDVALFQAGSGLSFCDMKNLTPDSVKVSNGVYYIQSTRAKTGIEYTSVLLPMAVEVWNKYGGNLPVISNQKSNYMLKLVGDLCGINKSLHTHIFRKTYATYLLNNGVRMDIVARAVGHTSTKQTARVYAFLHKETVINEIACALK